MSPRGFPADFLWGVATSAQQIEGAPDEAGRGESIWDRFASRPGAIADGTDARVACDHLRRWRDDLELMKWLGIGAYRFSISWPRVLPSGSGTANAAGLDFYDALVDGLLAAGIRPFVTLDHWDLPQALQDRGGWPARDTAGRFVEYADAVSRRLGDRVRHWVTHNEPWCIVHLGHEQGVHAPGLRDPAAALRAAHHLLLSHGRAVEVLRRNAAGAEVGIVLLLTPVQALSGSQADQEAARRLDGSFNRWYLDPLHGRGYPVDALLDHVRLGHLTDAEPVFVRPGDLDVIATSADFVGVNYYSRTLVRAGAGGDPVAVPGAPKDQLTAMGWEVYPDGLCEVLARLTRDYAPPRIYVTESGAAFDDPPGADGHGGDPRRVEYLRAHVAAAARSVADGVPLHGYFVWSLMDNFEWAQGLSKRFGLFHVDFATQQRTARNVARWYRQTLTGTTIPASLEEAPTRRHP